MFVFIYNGKCWTPSSCSRHWGGHVDHPLSSSWDAQQLACWKSGSTLNTSCPTPWDDLGQTFTIRLGTWENAGKMRRRRVLSNPNQTSINDMLRGIQPIWHRLKPGSTGILGLPGAAVDLTSNTYEIIGILRRRPRPKQLVFGLTPRLCLQLLCLLVQQMTPRWGGRNSKWNDFGWSINFVTLSLRQVPCTCRHQLNVAVAHACHVQGLADVHNTCHLLPRGFASDNFAYAFTSAGLNYPPLPKCLQKLFEFCNTKPTTRAVVNYS